MFCITCEITIEDNSHYRTELHAINVRRKLRGYPPFAPSELDSIGTGIDIASEMNSSEGESPDTGLRMQRKCLLCGDVESTAHYSEHGLSSEESMYIFERRCYICYEKFATTLQLFEHLESGRHRTASTDGFILYLQNGSVLYPPRHRLVGGSSNQNRLINSLRPFNGQKSTRETHRKYPFLKHGNKYYRIVKKKH